MTPTEARLMCRSIWLTQQRPELAARLPLVRDLGRVLSIGLGAPYAYYAAIHQWLDHQRVPEFYSVGQLAVCIGADTHKARLVRRVMWMAEHKQQYDQVLVQRYRMIEQSDRECDPRMLVVHDVLTGMGVPELYTNNYEYPVLWGTSK